MVESKHITLGLAIVPAASFISGYVFTLGYLGTFDPSLFSILTIQDYIAASLRWTSLAPALALAPIYFACQFAISEAKRWVGSSERRLESLRRCFDVPLAAIVIVCLLACAAIIAEVAQPGDRSSQLALVAAGMLFAGASFTALGAHGVLNGRALLSPITRPSIIFGPVFIGIALFLLWGALTAQEALKAPTHVLELETGEFESVVALQFVERGAVVYRVRDKATLLVPWARVKQIRRVWPERSRGRPLTPTQSSPAASTSHRTPPG